MGLCFTELFKKIKNGMFFKHGPYIQGGPKNWTCFSVDNSAMVIRRKACYMSKVLECCRQKGPNLHSKSFKYFCLICINLYYPWN